MAVSGLVFAMNSGGLKPRHIPQQPYCTRQEKRGDVLVDEDEDEVFPLSLSSLLQVELLMKLRDSMASAHVWVVD